MAETTTVARPYARAVFEHARAQKDGLKAWSEQLQGLAVVATDEAARGFLLAPGPSPDEKVAFLLGLSTEATGREAPEEMRNFLRLLAQNRRLTALGAVSVLFDELRAEAEKTLHAQVISAMEISAKQKKSIAAALKARLDREVELECTVDESLIGGAIIRAGDLVIDGSARGHLAKLATALGQ